MLKDSGANLWIWHNETDISRRVASNDREKLRKMRQKLVSLELETWHMALGGEAPWVLSSMHEAVRNHAKLIGQYESEALVRKAESWRIEVSPKPDWRETDYISKHGLESYDLSPDNTERVHPVTYLSEKGFTMITKQLREARFAYWKGWAELLIPILALIVAILALLKK